MKNRLFSLVIIILSVFFLTGCGENSKLNDIVDKFNSSKFVKSYADMGYNINATAHYEEITVMINSSDSDPIKLTFNFENDVLSGKFDMNNDASYFTAFVSLYLIDAIGQVNGYEEEEMIQSLNDMGILEYTLENEGLEISSSSDTFEFKVNINKKVPLIDFSEVYITTEDLESVESYIKEGSYSMQRGNVVMITLTTDGTTTITIAEKKELTSNSYNSLLSVVDVLFDSSKASKYVKSKYESIEEGDKEFAGVKVDVDYETDDESINSLKDSGYEIMNITINHKTFKKNMKK